jgi:hypothetical protein
MDRPPLPPKNYSWYSFLLEAQGHSAAGRVISMKNPMTPSGVKPETFHFVAQCLNHLRHRVIKCEQDIKTVNVKPVGA